MRPMGGGLTDLIVSDARSGTVQFRAYRVRVVEGPDVGKELRLERGSAVVGTSSDADLTLTDAAVSRAHLKLVPFTDGIEVTDLDSKNGTTVAGVRIQKARVTPGSELKIGRTLLRLSPEDRELLLEPSIHTQFGPLRGQSRAMRQLFSLLELVSGRDVPLLVEGERGAGKARVARALHERGPRAAFRLQVLDARELPDGDFMPELPTNVGSILVKHVDALGPEAQRAMLRMLERGDVDARFMATTTKDLDRLAYEDKFDRALVLRLGVLRVRVPPLRERLADLPVLIDDILAELTPAGGVGHFDLGPADLGRLQAYAWPDNVRELRSVLERAVSLESLGPIDASQPAPIARAEVVGTDLPYKQARSQMIEAFEREYVKGLLDRYENNVSKAARVAGIDRVYLHRLIRKYEL